MARKTVLPARTLPEVIDAFPSYRQSLLGTVDNCNLSALFSLENRSYTNAAQARGIIFHRTAAEILRTLQRSGEIIITPEEALQILYEVSAQRDVPPEDVVVVPMRERRLLRIGIIRLVGKRDRATGRVVPTTFRMKRLIDVERRLFTTVTYDDEYGMPIERAITGQPDALLADPPTRDDPVSGAIVLDWKMNLRPPPAGPETDHWDRPDSLSYMGYFQQRFYGLLILKTYPSVMRVRLREYYVLDGIARYATIYRQDVEHLEREFAILVELLDRALMGGSASGMWQPSPGKHCSYCAAPTRCPLSAAARAREDGIATWPEALKAAGEYVLAKQIGRNLHGALKNFIDAHGGEVGREYIPVKSAKGRYAVGFRRTASGDKRFTEWALPRPDRAPEQRDPKLDAAFQQAAERL